MINDGDIIERGGYRFRVDYEPDTDREAPWNDGDGQGIVRELNYGEPKRPGERILHHSSGSRTKWAFDWQATMKKAKAEGWGLGDDDLNVLKATLGRAPTNGEITTYAVQRNFDWMQRWLRDEWWYVGIVITHIADGESDTREPNYVHSVWGFDNDDRTYLSDEADSMIDEYVAELDEQKAADDAAEERARTLDFALSVAVQDLGKAIDLVEGPLSRKIARELRDELNLLARAAGVSGKEEQS